MSRVATTTERTRAAEDVAGIDPAFHRAILNLSTRRWRGGRGEGSEGFTGARSTDGRVGGQS